MTDANLVLYVASYPDAATAGEDFDSLKSAQEAYDFTVLGAVVLNRDAQGKVDVKEHGTGQVGGGAALGGTAGLVLGLFAPPLLLTTAIGAGIGAAIGALVKRHEEKKFGVDMEEYLPPGSSAIAAVVDDTYADRVDTALGKASKKIDKAIDSGDYDKLKKALSDAGHDVSDAITS